MTIKRDYVLYKYCLTTDKLKQDHFAPRFQQTTAAFIVGFAEFNYNLDVHTKSNIFVHVRLGIFHKCSPIGCQV